MSRFLRVGMIMDRIDDILEATTMLLEQISSEDAGANLPKAREMAEDIRAMALDLREFISRWDCEPIIYTGRGTTDEVITMLDQLISRAERRKGRGLHRS